MPHRRLLIVAAAAALLVAACAAGAPGASPTDTAAPPTATSAAVTSPPAASSTQAADATPPATPDDDYLDDYGPRPTPTATATAAAELTVTAITYGELGPYLAGPTQMALYTFDNDELGSSACSGDCAAAWPPLTVESGTAPAGGPGVTGELGTIERDDGTTQVTYDGAPLYYYAGDEQLYDVNGDGVGGVWHLARP